MWKNYAKKIAEVVMKRATNLIHKSDEVLKKN